MRTIRSINRSLSARFGGKVTAQEERGCVVLTGELSGWDEIVEAGRMSVRSKRHPALVNRIRLTGSVPPMRMPEVRDGAIDGQTPDVLIVGGGVIGCAIARELSRYTLSVLLVEKEHDVAMQASSRNDGMVHPGIELLPGQVKRRFCIRGNRMFDTVCRELGVPFSRTGQYLCFRSWRMALLVPVMLLFWNLSGVSASFIGKKALRKAEPELASDMRWAIRFPGAGVVCPYGLTIAYAENAADNGAVFSLDTAVTGMDVQDGVIKAVRTNRGTVYPKLVINAAGVFSDEVADMAGDRFFSIHPRKGTNAILDKKAAHQVRSIASLIRPSACKTQHTKGGGLVSTVDGNLLVGPDAHETCERENFATDAASIRGTFDRQREASPGLSERDIITYFTGVRAATYEEDFVLGAGRFTKNILHAAGIQSPGLTAAPAIACYIAKLAVRYFGGAEAVAVNPRFSPVRTPIPAVRELPDEARDVLIRQNPDYGVIVCRCEEISRGEIRDALRRSIPCDTVDGVKRRVRPGMGRCQGAFCGPQVLKIIMEETGRSPAQVKKSGAGSELLLSAVKQTEARA